MTDFKLLISDALSPDKRTPKTANVPFVLADEVQLNNDNIFDTYKDFQTIADWSAGVYPLSAKVTYGRAIYQSVINNNTTTPTVTDKWRLISPNFLGTDYRLKVDGSKMILEQALNDWFNASGIYIDTNSQGLGVFLVGISEDESSLVFSNKSSEQVINAYSFAEQFNCTIFVPIAVHTAIGGDVIVRNFADRYINAGITYNIQTY